MYADFEALGVQIVGVGWDNPDKTGPWVEREGFQFEIWTDSEQTLSYYYGAADESSWVPDRVTKVLDAQGNLVLEYNDIGLAVTTHPAQVLNDCQILFGD